jgi:hypothetical protein
VLQRNERLASTINTLSNPSSLVRLLRPRHRPAVLRSPRDTRVRALPPARHASDAHAAIQTAQRTVLTAHQSDKDNQPPPRRTDKSKGIDKDSVIVNAHSWYHHGPSARRHKVIRDTGRCVGRSTDLTRRQQTFVRLRVRLQRNAIDQIEMTWRHRSSKSKSDVRCLRAQQSPCLAVDRRARSAASRHGDGSETAADGRWSQRDERPQVPMAR